MESKFPKRFSIGAASEYLGVSIDTLRRWEKRGKIESLRSPGNHRYFSKEDLDKLFGKKYEHDTSKEKYTEVIEKEDKERVIKPEALPVKEQTEKTDTSTYASITYPTLETAEETPAFDRPVRDIRIPEAKLIRIIKADTETSSENIHRETHIQEVTTSILTPSALPQADKEPIEKEATNVPSEIKTTQNLKPKKNEAPASSRSWFSAKGDKIIIYAIIMIAFVILIGFVFFMIGASSKGMLSPVP